MGFAARADRDRDDNTEGFKKQNLVLLRPVKSFPRTLTSVSSQTAPRVPIEAPTKTAIPSERAVPAEVKQLPKTPRLPLGLKLLVGVQQGSTVLTGGLVATALVIYSWTVYLDKTVARSFQHLETLKVSTQQVTTANETLKHSMAQQAESPAAGFKPLEPKRAIFLSPAPARPLVKPELEPKVHSPMPQPLGY
ncbi:MAG: hypothetical protein AAFR24_15810 [Cyanobacteria bacterium J06627_3]